MIISELEIKRIDFPTGEMQINIVNPPSYGQYIQNIEFVFTKNEDIIELLQYCNAATRCGHSFGRLIIPYVPYSRQDRVNKAGESFSLMVFCDLVNSLGFKEVVVYDPHSDVTAALLKNVSIHPQASIFFGRIKEKKNYVLVSPDAGALKKTYRLSKELKCRVIECSKERDTDTGEISGIRCYGFSPEFDKDKEMIIVDDICDGGRTFIEIAKLLKDLGVKKITLMVTHGFFTKGMRVFDDLIDEIYTKDGRVK